jgi:hypothetical protein
MSLGKCLQIAPSTVDGWQVSGEGPIGARPYVRYLAADLPIVYLEYIYTTNPIFSHHNR